MVDGGIVMEIRITRWLHESMYDKKLMPVHQSGEILDRAHTPFKSDIPYYIKVNPTHETRVSFLILLHTS